jgi:hypothetical protein
MNINIQLSYSLLAIVSAGTLLYILKPSKSLILLPELIPYSMHYQNARSVLKDTEWRNIAKLVYKNSKFQCDICKAKGKLECHEIWNFDDRNYVQSLIGLTTLCPDCHRVKHIGLAKKFGFYDATLAHMAKINKISKGKAKKHIMYAEMEVKKRNQTYTLDLTYLNNYNHLLTRRYTGFENSSCRAIPGNC